MFAIHTLIPAHGSAKGLEFRQCRTAPGLFGVKYTRRRHKCASVPSLSVQARVNILDRNDRRQSRSMKRLPQSVGVCYDRTNKSVHELLGIKGVYTLSKSNNIILIGMMGTGKSTVAEMLANELGYQLVDLDAEVEKEEGCTIPEMFADKGEVYFRDAESRVLRNVLASESQVIATGGGIVLRQDNCDEMSGQGWVVALTADPEAIVERIGGSDHRPLLAGNAEERIRTIMQERKDAYLFAHHTVDTTELSAAEVTRLILAHYRV